MSDIELCCAALLLAAAIKRKRKKLKKRMWAKYSQLSRTKVDHYELLRQADGSAILVFENSLQMSEESFNQLLEKLTPRIAKKDTTMRDSISTHDRLSVTLRYLASGLSFQDLETLTKISQFSIGNFVKETCQAILDAMDDQIKLPSSTSEWELEAKRFDEKFDFPHCLGAIDGRHKKVLKREGMDGQYLNHNKDFTIIMLALVNAKSEFLAVEVDIKGAASGAEAFQQSKLCKRLLEGSLNLPNPSFLPYSEKEMSFVFVTDRAFPLMANILKPYEQEELEKEEADESDFFNSRLFCALRASEHAFTLLEANFKVLIQRTRVDLEKTKTIVLSCYYLHNYLCKRKDKYYLNNNLNDPLNEKNYDAAERLSKVQTEESNNSDNSEEATRIRNEFCQYFNGEGIVSWQ